MLVLGIDTDSGLQLTLPDGRIIRVVLVNIKYVHGMPYAKIGIDAPLDVTIVREELLAKAEDTAPAPPPEMA